jgi:hypothetical protein
VSNDAPPQASVEPRTLGGLARYLGRLGASGFGGPIVYARYQGLTVVQDVFFGVGPAVLGAIWYGGGLAWPRSAIGLTPLPFADSAGREPATSRQWGCSSRSEHSEAHA